MCSRSDRLRTGLGFRSIGGVPCIGSNRSTTRSSILNVGFALHDQVDIVKDRAGGEGIYMYR